MIQIKHEGEEANLTLRTRRRGGGGEAIVVVMAALMVDREKMSGLFSMHSNLGSKLRYKNQWFNGEVYETRNVFLMFLNSFDPGYCYILMSRSSNDELVPVVAAAMMCIYLSHVTAMEMER